MEMKSHLLNEQDRISSNQSTNSLSSLSVSQSIDRSVLDGRLSVDLPINVYIDGYINSFFVPKQTFLPIVQINRNHVELVGMKSSFLPHSLSPLYFPQFAILTVHDHVEIESNASILCVHLVSFLECDDCPTENIGCVICDNWRAQVWMAVERGSSPFERDYSSTKRSNERKEFIVVVDLISEMLSVLDIIYQWKDLKSSRLFFACWISLKLKSKPRRKNDNLPGSILR